MVIAKGWGEEGMRSCFVGKEFEFGKMEKFWRWVVVMVAQQCECS